MEQQSTISKWVSDWSENVYCVRVFLNSHRMAKQVWLIRWKEKLSPNSWVSCDIFHVFSIFYVCSVSKTKNADKSQSSGWNYFFLHSKNSQDLYEYRGISFHNNLTETTKFHSCAVIVGHIYTLSKECWKRSNMLMRCKNWKGNSPTTDDISLYWCRNVWTHAESKEY